MNTEVYKKVFLVNIDNFNHFKVKEPVIPFGTKYEELEEHDLYTSYHVILENITNTNYNIDKEVRKFGEFLGLKLSIEELKEKYREDGKYMNIARKAEKFMRDNNLVQYNDLEASHQYEIKDSYDTGKNEGRSEGLKTRSFEIAKNLLNDHLDINKITLTDLTPEQEKYLTYTLTYASTPYTSSQSDLSIDLAHGSTAPVKVRVEYIQPENPADLPSETTPITLNATLNYLQKA